MIKASNVVVQRKLPQLQIYQHNQDLQGLSVFGFAAFRSSHCSKPKHAGKWMINTHPFGSFLSIPAQTRPEVIRNFFRRKAQLSTGLLASSQKVLLTPQFFVELVLSGIISIEQLRKATTERITIEDWCPARQIWVKDVVLNHFTYDIGVYSGEELEAPHQVQAVDLVSEEHAAVFAVAL